MIPFTPWTDSSEVSELVREDSSGRLVWWPLPDDRIPKASDGDYWILSGARPTLWVRAFRTSGNRGRPTSPSRHSAVPHAYASAQYSTMRRSPPNVAGPMPWRAGSRTRCSDGAGRAPLPIAGGFSPWTATWMTHDLDE